MCCLFQYDSKCNVVTLKRFAIFLINVYSISHMGTLEYIMCIGAFYFSKLSSALKVCDHIMHTLGCKANPLQ